MLRKTPFVKGEYYHIYSRGVEKRRIFLNQKDYDRFTALLYIMNQKAPFRMDNFLQKENNIKNIFKEKREETLVSVLGYCLMPNHFHLILYEHIEGGISKFIGKVLTGYSMYFNKKYEHSGSLFTHPFKSQHINNEPQFMYIFSYLHLNPLSIFDSKWKEKGIRDIKGAENFLESYLHSSYIDFLHNNRSESVILTFTAIPKHVRQMKLGFKTFEDMCGRTLQQVQQGLPLLES